MIVVLRDDRVRTSRQNLRCPSHPVASSTLVRWGKFNLVGAIGIGVQFAALFMLKTALHLQYLAATAVAVEAAVLHNFVWHEKFTWADRTEGTTKHEQSPHSLRRNCGGSPMQLYSGFFRRLRRFHLANGAVSILGNLAIMRILVGSADMNYLTANAIAVAVCSLANFLLSDQWVFEN
jgi:putative flippase GtrA